MTQKTQQTRIIANGRRDRRSMRHPRWHYRRHCCPPTTNSGTRALQLQHRSERVHVPSLLSSLVTVSSAGYSMRIHNEASTHPPPGLHPRYAHAPDHSTASRTQNRDAVPLIHHVPTRFHFQEPRNSVVAHATSNSPSYSAHARTQAAAPRSDSALSFVWANRFQKPERTKIIKSETGTLYSHPYGWAD